MSGRDQQRLQDFLRRWKLRQNLTKELTHPTACTVCDCDHVAQEGFPLSVREFCYSSHGFGFDRVDVSARIGIAQCYPPM